MNVIVVGGGLAGLAAAAFAARGGATVTLFEMAHEPGGRARTSDARGFRLNLGPHALYRGGAAMRALRDLGIEPRGARPPSAGFAMDRGELHELPGSGPALFRTTLLDKAEKLEVAKRLVSLLVKDAPDVSVSEWLGAIRGDGARRFFSALVRVSTYAADHDRLSARAARAQIALALKHDVLYLDGGWEQLVTELRRAAISAGARIVTGTRVASASRDGVRLASGERVAGRPILAVTPDAVRDLTGVELQTHPVLASCLDVALRSLPKRGNRFLLGMDEPLYFSVHSRTAKLAPDGGAVIHAARYGGGGTEAELEALFDRLQPGWRELVVHRRFLPSMTVVHDSIEAGRTRHAIDAIPGLLVAGDWIGDEGMLADAALASARRAAEISIRERMAA